MSQAAGPPVSFAAADAIVQKRCVPCHSQRPRLASTAPLGIRLDTRAEIEARAGDIEQQAVQTHAMPLGNATHMTQDERDALARWLHSR